MSDCTERSEGQKGMPSRHSMSDCTERSELSMTTQATPVAVWLKRTNSVNRLTVGQETT